MKRRKYEKKIDLQQLINQSQDRAYICKRKSSNKINTQVTYNRVSNFDHMRR